MKKIFLLLIIMTMIFGILTACEKKHECKCSGCNPDECTCTEECELNPDGTCNCEGCPCKKKEEVKYIEARESSIIKTQTNIVIKRPELVGLKNKNLQENINKAILDSVKPYQDEISDISEGFAFDASDVMIKNKSYYYHVDYNTYMLDDYLSLVVNYDLKTGNYISGTSKTDGLRSSTWKETYVVDTSDSYKNETLKFADVCNIPNCSKVMATEVNKLAQSRGIDIILGNGLTEVPANQRFYIDGKKEKLVLYFEPGTIAKYSAGELLFEMPFKYNSSSHKFEQ